MDSRLAIAGAIGACWLGAWSVAEGAGPQKPEFSSTTELVRVYATVRDRSGRLVTDLREDEFDLRDRGTRVPLAVFSTEAQPITVAVTVDMTGWVFDGRTHEVVRRALTAFIDKMEPRDRARIAWFTKSEIATGQELSADRDALKQMVYNEIRPERAHPRLDVTKGFIGPLAGRPLWNAIGVAMQSLAQEPGRKVVLVLANGPNTSTIAGAPGLSDIKARLPMDEFMIYGVVGFEPRSADPSSYDTTRTTLREVTEMTGGGYFEAPSDPRRRSRAQGIGDENPDHHLDLAFVGMLAGVADELRQQYTLGFVPTKRDGKVGKIEVRSKRPNTRVWARQAYVAPTE